MSMLHHSKLKKHKKRKKPAINPIAKKAIELEKARRKKDDPNRKVMSTYETYLHGQKVTVKQYPPERAYPTDTILEDHLEKIGLSIICPR